MIRCSLHPARKYDPPAASAPRENLLSIRNIRTSQRAHFFAWRAGEFQAPRLPCLCRFLLPEVSGYLLRQCPQSFAPPRAWLGWRHERRNGRRVPVYQALLPIESFHPPELPFHLFRLRTHRRCTVHACSRSDVEQRTGHAPVQRLGMLNIQISTYGS